MTTTISGTDGVDNIKDNTIAASDIQAGAVTAAKLDTTTSFAGTKTTTGSQILPNGLILKWGLTAISANGQAVSFGTSFPTACLNVTATPAIGSAPAIGNLVGVSGLTTSQFNVWFGTAQSIYWTAIGY